MATLLKPFITESKIISSLQREPINVESALGVAANNIVKLGSRSQSEVVRIQRDFKEFSTFLDVSVKELKAIALPDSTKIRRFANLNLTDVFGTTGGLLSSLVSGALNVGGLLGGMFPGKGRPVGGKPGDIRTNPKPTPKGSRLKIPGLRAVPILNTIFTGLDFATGLAEGETIGKAAAGAGGSLAGSLLGGAIGQTLIPVPGLGFIIGSAAGGFLGGYLGDRTYDAVAGGGAPQDEKTQEEQAKDRTKRELERDRRRRLKRESSLEADASKFETSIENFDKSTSSFEDFVKDLLSGKIDIFGGGSPSTRRRGGGSEETDGKTLSSGVDYSNTSGEIANILPMTKNGPTWNEGVGYGRGYLHAGQDLGLDVGDPIHARRSGKYIKWIPSFTRPGQRFMGGAMVVKYDNGQEAVYGHVESPIINVGDSFLAGQKLTTVYPDGKNTHLHYELRDSSGNLLNPAEDLRKSLSIPPGLKPSTSGRTSGTTPSSTPQPQSTTTLNQQPQPDLRSSALPTSPLSSTIATASSTSPPNIAYLPGIKRTIGVPGGGSRGGQTIAMTPPPPRPIQITAEPVESVLFSVMLESKLV